MKNPKSKNQNYLKAKSLDKVEDSRRSRNYKLKACEGVTIYLALMLVSGAVAIALAVSTILVGEMNISRDALNSLKAVYMADSVLEYTLYQTRPAATYDSNTHTLITDNYGNIPVSSPIEILTSSNCHYRFPEVGDALIGISCNSRIELVDKDSVPGCSNISATDCTRIVTHGSFGGTNRALEIVYPNL